MAAMTPMPAQELRRVVRDHGRSFEWLARAGYATRAYLYFAIGGLAGLAAFGYGGDTTDGKGALVELYRQPFGQALLVLASIGLFGFAIFRGYHAIVDPEGEARGIRAAKRVGWAAIALAHAGLGVFAISLASGNSQRAGGDDTRSATASLLSWTPVGPWLVAGVGAYRLIPKPLRKLVVDAYVEGIFASQHEQPRPGETEGNSTPSAAVLLELRYPHDLLTEMQYGPGARWSVDLGWEP